MFTLCNESQLTDFFIPYSKEGSEEMSLEALIQLLTTGELLVALGEDFGKNESAHLKNLLRNKSRQFLEK